LRKNKTTMKILAFTVFKKLTLNSAKINNIFKYCIVDLFAVLIFHDLGHSEQFRDFFISRFQTVYNWTLIWVKNKRVYKFAVVKLTAKSAKIKNFFLLYSRP
jgi:hypothetical protein